MIVPPPTSYLILLIPIPPFQIKENYEIIFVSFCVFLLESFDVFWIFLLLFSMLIWFFVKISPHFYNQIKQGSFILPKRITNPCTLFNPNKPKGLFNFCEVKIFGCVTHSSVQDQFRISCVWHGFIFCTIKTYKISMKVLDWNKFNYFCVDTLCFSFSSTFCSEFCSNFSETTEVFLWGCFSWLTSFWACTLEFLSNMIVFVNWGTVFNLEISSWLLLDTKLTYFSILFWFLCCQKLNF